MRTAAEDRPVIVACLGSSSTAGQGQAFGWINELAQRPQNQRFRFQNLGVGGDFAYNALRRVPSVVACRPDIVVVLIGANDALTMVFQNAGRVLGGWMKHLPKAPSVEWFQESLESIVRQLEQETSARIGLSSLGPIGEDPNSANPVQHELNMRIAVLSGIIKQAAITHKVGYIPFYEKFHEQLLASPGKAFTEFRFLPIYRDTWRFYVLRRTSDEIARANGWQFHVDGIHLNRRGGVILANLVQEFLDGQVVAPRAYG